MSVFLYEELGWEPLLNIKNDPRPVLLSVLCFFHGKRRLGLGPRRLFRHADRSSALFLLARSAMPLWLRGKKQ